MKKAVLGVDIGDVIINHRVADKNDRELYENRYSTIPAGKGVFDALKELNTEFDGNVFLVSKCSEWAQKKILEWLSDNNFHTYTGIPTDHVRFCRERHEKLEICSQLGITHFIDNRLEVLSHLVETVPHLYLYQPDPTEVEEFITFLPRVHRVETWDIAVAEILKSIRTPNKTNVSAQETFNSWGLAWELGYEIAIPLVAFALLGRFGDRYFDTSPWLLLVGVITAAIVTSYLVFRKVSKFLK